MKTTILNLKCKSTHKVFDEVELSSKKGPWPLKRFAIALSESETSPAQGTTLAKCVQPSVPQNR